MLLTVVLFHSDYCPTCEEVMGAWREFVELHRGEGVFMRIKKDGETQRIFRELGISWVPTVVFYLDEKEVRRVEGFFTLSDLERALRRVLSKAAITA
ncbi:MAG: thioredoxin family protein [Crenarchaeota archaeon]|nr:thioredoxin family protein [Thermoproteota archaeon]